MSVPKTAKELNEKIEIEKDLLLAMPRNTEKNKNLYVEKIDELLKEYTNYQNKILEDIKSKYNSQVNIDSSKEIENLDIRIKTISDNFNILNNYKTSYEKMDLDKYIYRIRQYYKENLDNVNSQIQECVRKFTEVGIKLSSDDFNYSSYVNQYMQVFFDEQKKDDINSSAVKQRFEELYWKCPDILIHIELNLRNIYFKNEQQIDKYFEKEKNELLKKWDKNTENIIDTYYELKKRKDELMAVNPKYILDKFMLGELKTKDFSETKLNSNYEKILSDEIIKSIKDGSKDAEDNILKFLNSLYEYKNYLKFKFLIDDVKTHYQEKENYKKVHLDTKKKIDNEEKNLNKIRNNISKKGLFGRKKDNSEQLILQNQKILEIKALYKELDFNKFYNKIYTELTDTSSLYDVLKLVSSYYFYIMKCIISNQDITREEADEMIDELQEFLENPNNTIINNLTISEDKNIALVIKDRYKLLDFKIEKEDVTEQNLDNLISILENIANSFNFKTAGIDIEEVETLLEYKKILE